MPWLSRLGCVKYSLPTDVRFFPGTEQNHAFFYIYKYFFVLQAYTHFLTDTINLHKGKVSGDDHGLQLEANAAALGTLQSKIALAVVGVLCDDACFISRLPTNLLYNCLAAGCRGLQASTRQPYLNQVVSKVDVDELSQSLLMVRRYCTYLRDDILFIFQHAPVTDVNTFFFFSKGV